MNLLEEITKSKTVPTYQQDIKLVGYDLKFIQF